MERRNALDWLAWTLTIVGGVNWGLVGFFQFDLVAAIFGGQDALLARVVYGLVGLSALYSIYSLSKTAAPATTTHRATQ
jgi:uncharacterized protein